MLYPPILDKSLPPFLVSESLNVYFNLSNISKLSELKHYQVRISRQDNYKNLVKSTIFPDQIIYKDISRIVPVSGISNRYYITIDKSDLNETLQAGVIYKIQMRFGSEEFVSSMTDFSTWKNEQIKKNQFSEWSTATIIKGISSPSIAFVNTTSQSGNSTLNQAIELTTTPLFQAQYKTNETDKEFLEKYKFDLYYNDEKLYSSDWITYNANDNGICNYRFKQDLENNKSYVVKFATRTINGYEPAEVSYAFQCQAYTIPEISKFIISCSKDSENGCIKLYGTVNDATIGIEDKVVFTGSYVISRTDEKSNFSIWEDIKYFSWIDKTFREAKIDLFYTDYLIESGIQYKYAFQKVYSTGYRTQKITTDGYISVDFEYGFLVSGDKQLKLKFDNKMSSFKHSIISSKLDTIGSKYATVNYNGYANYAEFPITGLVSLHMDEENTFFTYKPEKGYYYGDELVIPSRKMEIDENEYRAGAANRTLYYSSFDNNFTYDNIFIERKFREKVEEFLNNKEYKLFKSPTEGNIIIALTNVSWTPNETLGRAIYSFSSTAYEVAENTIENIKKYGISDVGSYSNVGENEYKYVVGQEAGYFTADQNIFNTIKEKQNNSIASDTGDYVYIFDSLESLSVEIYPLQSIQSQILAKKGEKSELQMEQDFKNNYSLNADAIEQLEQEIEELEKLEEKILSVSLNNYQLVLKIDGQQIYAKGKIEFDSDEIQSELKVFNNIPVIINYVAKNTIKANDEKIPKALYEFKGYGQLYGVFTQNLNNQDFYNPELTDVKYERQTQVPYLVLDNKGKLYSTQNILDRNNNLLIPVPMYNTLDIRDIIMERTLKDMSAEYNTEFIFTPKTMYNIVSKSKNYIANLQNIGSIEIEAPIGTKLLLIGKKRSQIIQIGKTGRIVLDSLNQDINNGIQLLQNTWAIINYKCSVIVTEMESITKGGQ